MGGQSDRDRNGPTQRMTDTLAQRKVFGVLVPNFNSAVEPELADLRPEGVSNQTARFEIDATVLQNVVDAAKSLVPSGVEAWIVGLSTESFPDGLALLQQGAQNLVEETGLPIHGFGRLLSNY